MTKEILQELAFQFEKVASMIRLLKKTGWIEAEKKESPDKKITKIAKNFMTAEININVRVPLKKLKKIENELGMSEFAPTMIKS